ncbi:MAG TPA: acetyltransferase [Planctomycetes bacterium]|nr:acetyltransferase [Planctomycetota bacterium]
MNKPALLISALTLLSATTAHATEKFDPSQATEVPTKRWAKTERLDDPHPKMKQEKFIPLVAHHDPELAEDFGSKTPSSRYSLLHYAKGIEEADQSKTPVLLVHGAGLTSNHCYADKPIEQPYPGLAARLIADKIPTFALTFSHIHGDNYLQAEQVANAIARIRHVTGAKKVDLVAHSKGGVSTRIYVSSAGHEWMTKFREDVRRYVMLGTPNLGIDVSFAYPNLNYWILEHKSPAPMSWLNGLYYGKRIDWSDRTLYGPDSPFPGQAQLVERWDQRYGRTTSKGQFDVDSTYDGGKGLVSHSLGIDRAIKDGGHCIARLQKKPVHKSVELAVLAGSHSWVMGLVGERRGPSDGLLLVESAFATEPMEKDGAKLIRKDLRRFNHLELVYHPRANDWVAETLAMPTPKED